MEPLLAMASAITTYVLPKALEKIGEKVGEASLDKSKEAIQTIQTKVRGKLTETHTDGVLDLAMANTTEANIEVLKAVLASQMQHDAAFAEEMRSLLNRIQAQSPQLQVVLENVRIKGNAKMGTISQTDNSAVSQQVIGRNLGVGGDLEIDNIVQKR